MRVNQNNQKQQLSFLAGFLFLLISVSFWQVHNSQALAEPLTITAVTSAITSAGLVEISWQTNKLSDSLVEYSIDDSFSQQQKISHLSTEHAILLPRLVPNTFYHYRVASINPQGERVVGPHLFLISPTQADVSITQLQFRSGFRWYDQERPLLGAHGFDLQIINSVQETISNNFSLSFLLSKTDDTNDSSLGYSCFAQYDHQRNLPAKTTETILLDANLLAHCETLTSGSYTLTVAVDYDDQIIEADETNNVSTIDIIVAEQAKAPQFISVKSFDIQATSTAINFQLADGIGHQPAVLDVAPAYYVADHPGMYLWSQDTLLASSTYMTLIQGLQAETLYHFRLRLLDSNITSDDYTFRTIKDEGADSSRLLILKLTNTDCRVVSEKPLKISFWQDLGLNVPKHEILRYRILWFSGSRSPWYTPGSGDEDWQMNTHGNPRRVWSYFQDHSFEYETCGAGITTAQSNKSAVLTPETKTTVPVMKTKKTEEKYHLIINRSAESSNGVIKYKITTVQGVLRFYRVLLAAKDWQVIQDAYVYGGYRLSELEQTLRHDSGLVHPTIPAVVWRKQIATKPIIAITNH